MIVDPGSDVTLNCLCPNQANGYFEGPVVSSLMDTSESDLMPYSDRRELNPKLDKAKFEIVGNFENDECNLKIKHFTRQDSGIYQCQYMLMDNICMICSHVYIVAMTSNYFFFVNNSHALIDNTTGQIVYFIVSLVFSMKITDIFFYVFGKVTSK